MLQLRQVKKNVIARYYIYINPQMYSIGKFITGVNYWKYFIRHTKKLLYCKQWESDFLFSVKTSKEERLKWILRCWIWGRHWQRMQLWHNCCLRHHLWHHCQSINLSCPASAQLLIQLPARPGKAAESNPRAEAPAIRMRPRWSSGC